MRYALIVLLLAAPARAAFDENGFSARALGMGSSWTAVYDDVGSLGYNPASLGQLRAVQSGSNYLRQYNIPAGPGDIEQINSSLGIPINQDLLRGAVGLSWAYTTEHDYAVDRTFIANWASRGFQEFPDSSLELGASLKFMNRNYAAGGGAVKATVDLGALYRFWEKYAVGFSFLNFNGPSFSDDRVPVTAKIGVSETVGGFTMALDLTKREAGIYHGGSTNIGAGVENWWSTPRAGSYALRTGLSLGDQTKTWHLGIGWRMFGAELDYAMTVPLVAAVNLGHCVGLVFRFGQSDPEAHYERLLKNEERYRKDLTDALEAGEVKQWKLAEELSRLREEIEVLRGQLADKIISENEARKRAAALEEKRRQAQETYDKIQVEERRLKAVTKDMLFSDDWKSYEKLKASGAPEAVLLDQVKRLLRQYKDSGVDLSKANLELQRLLRGR
jgi:hypothetical protein